MKISRSWLLAAFLAFAPGHARADEPSESAPAVSPEVARARELYKEGVEHVKRLEWAEGLAAFEASAEKNPHATTSFNIGACERALGNYTRARIAFTKALEQEAATPGQLAPSLKTEATTLLGELQGLLAHVVVSLEPKEALLSLDGRPLTRTGSGVDGPVLEAGLEPAGRGHPAPANRFEIVLNPGAHVLTLGRRGYADSVVSRTFAPGSKTHLSLVLSRLPATLRISANVDGALVRVGSSDVGPVPAEVQRPAGRYHVVVDKDGYDRYETDVAVQAGELSEQRASLKVTHRPITKEWWFWAAGAAVVVGGAFATYALTRPEPDPPPYSGGSTGWVARPQLFHF